MKRSQLRFVMSPADERDFAAYVFSDASVRAIDGAAWTTPTPESIRSIDDAQRTHWLIWSTRDVDALTARQVANRSEWRCESTWAPIQLLRSERFESVITVGRIAIGTVGAPNDRAANVERRYRAFSSFIKKRYSNSVLRWALPTVPPAPGSVAHTANSRNDDHQLWVGPHALQWLREEHGRRVKLDKDSVAEASLNDRET